MSPIFVSILDLFSQQEENLQNSKFQKVRVAQTSDYGFYKFLQTFSLLYARCGGTLDDRF